MFPQREGGRRELVACPLRHARPACLTPAFFKIFLPTFAPPIKFIRLFVFLLMP